MALSPSLICFASLPLCVFALDVLVSWDPITC